MVQRDETLVHRHAQVRHGDVLCVSVRVARAARPLGPRVTDAERVRGVAARTTVAK